MRVIEIHSRPARGWWIPCLLVLVAINPGPMAAQEGAFQKVVAPFLKQHCIACHGPKKQESRLRLDELTGVQLSNRNLWTMVHERVAASEMPPKDRPQPTDAEKKQVLAWIGDQQRTLGVGGTRRLNRRELSAALRDVTGLAVDFSVALPGDGTIAGFDTGADGLQEASDSVAQWLQITRRAIDGIRFLEPAKDKSFSANLRESKDPRKNLFVYGKGRVPDIDDRMEIAAIMKASRAKEYPLRDLLRAVVRSRAFLELHAPLAEPHP